MARSLLVRVPSYIWSWGLTSLTALLYGFLPGLSCWTSCWCLLDHTRGLLNRPGQSDRGLDYDIGLDTGGEVWNLRSLHLRHACNLRSGHRHLGTATRCRNTHVVVMPLWWGARYSCRGFFEPINQGQVIWEKIHWALELREKVRRGAYIYLDFQGPFLYFQVWIHPFVLSAFLSLRDRPR